MNELDIKITKPQLELMKHAIGLDNTKSKRKTYTEFIRDEINKLMDGSPISELRLEAMKLRQCIEECEERLEDIEKEIEELQKSSV